MSAVRGLAAKALAAERSRATRAATSWDPPPGTWHAGAVLERASTIAACEAADWLAAGSVELATTWAEAYRLLRLRSAQATDAASARWRAHQAAAALREA